MINLRKLSHLILISIVEIAYFSSANDLHNAYSILNAKSILQGQDFCPEFQVESLFDGYGRRFVIKSDFRHISHQGEIPNCDFQAVPSSEFSPQITVKLINAFLTDTFSWQRPARSYCTNRIQMLNTESEKKIRSRLVIPKAVCNIVSRFSPWTDAIRNMWNISTSIQPILWLYPEGKLGISFPERNYGFLEAKSDVDSCTRKVQHRYAHLVFKVESESGCTLMIEHYRTDRLNCLKAAFNEHFCEIYDCLEEEDISKDIVRIQQQFAPFLFQSDSAMQNCTVLSNIRRPFRIEGDHDMFAVFKEREKPQQKNVPVMPFIFSSWIPAAVWYCVIMLRQKNLHNRNRSRSSRSIRRINEDQNASISVSLSIANLLAVSPTPIVDTNHSAHSPTTRPLEEPSSSAEDHDRDFLLLTSDIYKDPPPPYESVSSPLPTYAEAIMMEDFSHQTSCV